MSKIKEPPFHVSIDEVFAILKSKKIEIDGSFNEGAIETGFEITPYDFLKYAEIDLASNSTHKYINALSNAKRSLDGQLDTLLMGFGYYKMAKKEFWSFPKKIELLKSLGILTPRVLSKINKTRNLMEHEFKSPVPDQVEDFIDIVSLFLAATGNYTLKFIYEKGIRWEGDGLVAVTPGSKFWLASFNAIVNYRECQLEFKFRRHNVGKRAGKTIIIKKVDQSDVIVGASDPNYKELLKLFLRIEFDR